MAADTQVHSGTTPSGTPDAQVDATEAFLTDAVPGYAIDIVDPAHLGTFTSELRPTARRRRFQRSESTPLDAPVLPAPTAGAGDHRATQSAAAPPAPRPAMTARQMQAESAGLTGTDSILGAAWSGADGLRQLIDRQHAMLVELSRLSDRLIEAADRATRAELRAERAELDLAATQQRLLAARGLVGDAQRIARTASERAAFVEGRADALQSTLDEALSGSWLTRRRLRREHAALR